MAAGCPTRAETHEPTVINIADIKADARGWPLYLGMTFQTKVHVPLDQHLCVNGAVGRVADDASFTEGGVFKDDGACFFAVAIGAGFVLPCHSQASRRFHDVHSVWIVAIDAVHLSFEHGVMLGKMKFGLRFLMTLETGFGVFARIDDEFVRAPTPGRRDVFAAGAVARFAPALAGHLRLCDP